MSRTGAPHSGVEDGDDCGRAKSLPKENQDSDEREVKRGYATTTENERASRYMATGEEATRGGRMSAD
jgi:hypothetical protein